MSWEGDLCIGRVPSMLLKALSKVCNYGELGQDRFETLSLRHKPRQAIADQGSSLNNQMTIQTPLDSYLHKQALHW